MGTRKPAFAVLVAIFSAILAAVLFIALGTSSSARTSAIPGVTNEDLSLMGLNLEPAQDTPKVSIEDANAVAMRGGDLFKILDTTLVRVSERHDPENRPAKLAWAVRLDPDTVPDGGPMARPPEGRTWPPTKTNLALTFVDAETGEEMFTAGLAGWVEPTPEWLAEDAQPAPE